MCKNTKPQYCTGSWTRNSINVKKKKMGGNKEFANLCKTEIQKLRYTAQFQVCTNMVSTPSG